MLFQPFPKSVDLDDSKMVRLTMNFFRIERLSFGLISLLKFFPQLRLSPINEKNQPHNSLGIDKDNRRVER